MTNDTLTRHLPTTKAGRIALALSLKKHAVKADQRAWNKTRLGKADADELLGLIFGWAGRARRGKVAHLSALAGATTACRADSTNYALSPLELLTTPFAGRDADDVTCKGCRDAAGMPSPEEDAAWRAAEEKRIAAETTPAETSEPRKAKTTKRRRGRPASKGINPKRFEALADGGCSVELVGTYKGQTFRAFLTESGEVSLESGEPHPSLSRAACAVRKTKTCNGWRFWTLAANGEPASWLRESDERDAEAA